VTNLNLPLVTITSYAPSDVLRPFVDRYSVYEFNDVVDIIQNLIPSNLQNVGFTLEGKMYSNIFLHNHEVSRSYVMGQITSPVIVCYGKKIKILVIHFHASGMFRLFGIPMQQFTNRGMDFESLLNPEDRKLVDHIFDTNLLENQMGWIEILLQKRLASIKQTPPAYIQIASQFVLYTHGKMKVQELAYKINMSERTLQRHFSQQVGIKPKTFAGIARIKRTMQLIEQKPKLNWKDLAYTLDYTDQSHFIHEFKKFAGKTPSEYYRDRRDFEHILYGQ